MKQISRPVRKGWVALLGALAVFTMVQSPLSGKDTPANPQFNLEKTPLNREAKGVSYAPVIKRAAPSVVNIYSTRTIRTRSFMNPFSDPFFRRFFGPDNESPDRRSRGRKEKSLGSGVIVSSDGYILTANHVVDEADEIKVSLADGGKEFTAKVIGTDRPTDVAVLKLDAKDLPAIPITDSDELQVGDVVLAIGNPFGVGQTVTMGIVSAVGRTALDINEYEDFIQTDAAINPGNSGGALVDAEGRLVGINTAIFSRSGGNEGVGFVVPVNLARSVMERLIQYGKVTRGSLGVRLQEEITPELAAEFNLPDQSGAMIAEVLPDKPAAKAGLRNGDVIRQVDGRKISDMHQLRLAISQTPPGTKVTVTFLRSENGKEPEEKKVDVVLGTLPEDRAGRNGRANPDDENPPAQDSLDGVEVTDIDAGARRELNIPVSIHGALVSNVDPDSNAAAAGLRQGDVILEIKGQPVNNADDAVDLSRKVKGDRVLLRVWRAGGRLYIAVNNSKDK
jgi:serine protease Do